jgi:hypothetical protein
MVKWNRNTQERFIQNLGEVLNEQTILSLGQQLAAVQGYRFRRRDDRLFMLKSTGENFANSWDKVMADPSKSIEDAQDAYLNGFSKGLYQMLGLPEPTEGAEWGEAFSITAKITVSAKAAEDPAFLAGRSIEATCIDLVTGLGRRAVDRVLNQRAEDETAGDD